MATFWTVCRLVLDVVLLAGGRDRRLHEQEGYFSIVAAASKKGGE
jgi:hypothetical protein